MKNLSNRQKLALMGAVIGLGGTIAVFQPVNGWNWLPWFYPVIGAVLGYYLRDIIDNWLSAAKDIGINELTFKFPLISDTKISLTNAQQEQLRALYMGLSNRVIAQDLRIDEENTGLIREAMDSLYTSLTFIRDTLKTMPASSADEIKAKTSFEHALYPLINQVLRPFLSRWHPRLKSWESNGLPESLWPLNSECRQDLAITKENAMLYMEALREGLGIAKLEPNKEAKEKLSPLTETKSYKNKMTALAPTWEAVTAENGWRFLVELNALTPWLNQSRNMDEKQLALFLNDLPIRLPRLRREAKEIPASVYVPDGGDAMEIVALKIVNHLSSFASQCGLTTCPQVKNTSPQQEASTPLSTTQCLDIWRQMEQALYDDLKRLNTLTGGIIYPGK